MFSPVAFIIMCAAGFGTAPCKLLLGCWTAVVEFLVFLFWRFFVLPFWSHQRPLLKCLGNAPLACSDHQDDAWWLVRARLPDLDCPPPFFIFLFFFLCVFIFLTVALGPSQ
jgi:hypothetical protein